MDKQRYLAGFLAVVLVLVAALSVGAAGAVGDPTPPPLQPVETHGQVLFAPGRVLVKLAAEGDVRAFDSADSVDFTGEVLSLGSAAAAETVHVVEVAPGKELETAKQLAQAPGVVYAEPDYVYRAFEGEAVPNDKYYAALQWQMVHIGADRAWDTTTGSGDVIIAIVDTGVDLGHPEFAGKIVPGYDFANDDDKADDDQGHGTHVASIAGGLGNNGEGIAGVAWGAKIMPVKVLAASGSGSSLDVAKGIRWAADNGADIINLSLGGPGNSATLELAVNYAVDKGALVIAATGNEYEEGNAISYPSAYPRVLSVAASNDGDGHARYSNSGAHVKVSAPGGDPDDGGDGEPRHWIAGAYWRGSGFPYAQLAGTSQAAPHVAGLAALLLSVNPSLTPAELETIIIETAIDVLEPGYDEFSGHGRINIAAAVAVASVGVPIPPPPPPPPNLTEFSYLPMVRN